MRRLEFLLPVALVIYGGYVMWNALARMVYYNHVRGAPGPGFLPFWLALGLIVLGVVVAVQAVRSPVMQAGEQGGERELRKIGFVLAALAVVLLAFNWLGFIVTTAAFIIVVAYRLGVHAGRVLVPVALLASIGAYALFTWLGVDLPRGVIKL